jgi:hypothetical protein
MDIHNTRVYGFCLSYSYGNLGQIKKKKIENINLREMTTHSMIKTLKLASVQEVISLQKGHNLHPVYWRC